jgi:hypothetical protein
MQLISRLEQDFRLDEPVRAGQRAARLIRPGTVRDGLHRSGSGTRCARCWCKLPSAPGYRPASWICAAMTLYGAPRGPGERSALERLSGGSELDLEAAGLEPVQGLRPGLAGPVVGHATFGGVVLGGVQGPEALLEAGGV